MSNRLFDEISSEPDAYFLLDKVKEMLNAEKVKRIAFYNDITEQQKMEFINGQIVVHSPVMKRHNTASLLLASMINIYVLKNKLGFVGIEKIMITLTRNDYEPDICFFKNEKADLFHSKQTLFPAPDFIVEILSEGTKERDRGVKFKDYQAHGVEEYWIIDADKQFVEQYILTNGEYELHLKSSEGSIKSTTIDGFQIPIQAIFDEAINLQAITGML
jgi:Uma2 family endonuclease